MDLNNDETPHEPRRSIVWLDNQQVLQWLNCTARQLRYWRQTKRLPFKRMGGNGKIIYDQAEVQKALDEGRIWRNKEVVV